MQISTRYSVRPRNTHIRSVRDEVDRASYIDSTLQIRRFIDEGRSLAEHRAAALRAGVYLNYDDAMSDDVSPAIPVYDTDPALLHPVIESAVADFETRSKARHNVRGVEAGDAVDKGNKAIPEADSATSPASDSLGGV